jgi:Protein of unknown function (DUF2933)
MNTSKQNSSGKRQNITLWVVLGIILYFLITEHWAHIVPFLPWLLLVGCALMHLFMHGKHDHGSGHGTDESHSHHKKD